MIYQALAIGGAILVLVAYFLLQRGRLERDSRIYNLMNFLGGALLTVVAVHDGRIGFIVLEGMWALLSLPGVFGRTKRAAS